MQVLNTAVAADAAENRVADAATNNNEFLLLEQKMNNLVINTKQYDNNADNNDTTQALLPAKDLSCSQYFNTPNFDGISLLTPNLLLCGANVATPQLFDALEVRFVINVAPELPDTPLSSKTKPLYLHIPVLDRPEADLYAHFDEVSDIIEEVRKHNGVTVVHCVAGVSRSATLCIAYLMKHMGMSLRDAYQHVKTIRSQIRPNLGFFQQLRKYEEQLYNGNSSVQMVFYESLNKAIPDVFEPDYRAMEEFYQRHRKAFRNTRS